MQDWRAKHSSSCSWMLDFESRRRGMMRKMADWGVAALFWSWPSDGTVPGEPWLGKLRFEEDWKASPFCAMVVELSILPFIDSAKLLATMHSCASCTRKWGSKFQSESGDVGEAGCSLTCKQPGPCAGGEAHSKEAFRWTDAGEDRSPGTFQHGLWHSLTG